MSFYFTTRVELHDLNDENNNQEYETLHAEMVASNFRRTVLANNNVEYHLPDAEYIRFDIITTTEVLNLAMVAVRTALRPYYSFGDIDHMFTIFVTGRNEIVFHNLNPVINPIRHL